MNLYYETHKGHVEAFYSTNMQFPLHLHRQLEILYVMEGDVTVRFPQYKEHQELPVPDSAKEAAMNHTVRGASVTHAEEGDSVPHVTEGDSVSHVTEGASVTHTTGRSRVHTQTAIREESLHAGSLFWAFPNILHAYETPASSRSAMLIFDPEFTGDYQSVFRSLVPSSPILTGSEDRTEIEQLLHTIIRRQGSCDVRLLKGYFTVLTGLLLTGLQLRKNTAAEQPGFAGEVLQYLAEHYTEPLTLESTAYKMGVTSSKLSRIFSFQIGTPFHTYLHSLRVGYAQHLLSDMQLSITEIAYQSGFESQRTFNRVFRNASGLTPGEYRAMLLQSPTAPGSV